MMSDRWKILPVIFGILVLICLQDIRVSANSTVTVTNTSSTGPVVTHVSCGQWATLLPDAPQSFQSANFPKNYPNNAHCVWQLSCLIPGQPMVITFNTFKVTSSASCQEDYLNIDNGGSVTFHHLCGSDYHTQYVMRQDRTRLLFRSDAARTDQGFNFTALCTATPPTTQTPHPTSTGNSPAPNHVCGQFGTMTPGATPMNISSPGFPANYLSNYRCKWSLMCMGGYLSMNMGPLNIEPSTNCTKDRLIILNGGSSTSPQLASLCGDHPAKTYTTTGTTIRLEFDTDSAVTGKAWSATVNCIANTTTTTVPPTTPTTAAPAPTTTPATAAPAPTTESPIYITCGEYRGASPGVPMRFKSMDHPSNYPNNLYCTWDLECYTPNLPMTIKFTSFNVASSPSCTKDYVNIFNGPTETSPVVARLCGTGASVRKVFVVQNQFVRLGFRTDSTLVASGFEGVAECVQPAATPTTKPAPVTSPGQTTVPVPRCGELLLLNGGATSTIKSPQYPMNYPNDSRCIWTVGCNKTSGVVRIVFDQSIIQQSTGCKRDQLIIRDGQRATSPILATLCGTIADKTTYTTTNGTIRLEFNTDKTITAKGYQAKVTCISNDWKAIKVCKGSSISPYLLYMMLPAAYLSISSLIG